MKTYTLIFNLVILILGFSCSQQEDSKDMMRNGIQLVDWNLEKEKGDAYKDTTFVNDAPSYRILKPGLNLEAECLNCKIWVWADIKDVKGNFIEDRYRGNKLSNSDEVDDFAFRLAETTNRCYCPNCSEKIDNKRVLYMGFYNCKYFICGLRQAGDEIDKIGGDSTKIENGFRYFNNNKLEWWRYVNVAVWK